MKTLAFTALAAATLATAAPAQTANCGDRDFVIERLASRYGETRQGIGLGANNQLMEVFASADTGTWTITFTNPNGVTCLIASGQNFALLAEDLVSLDPGA